VPLARDLTVRVGDVVIVRVRYQRETTWNQVLCEAHRLGFASDVAAVKAEAAAQMQ
jgi:hypothetical protein